LIIEIALYILTGLTLYAGAHHLLLDTRGTASRWYFVSLGAMYLLLSGFALTSTLGYQVSGVTELLPAGKLAITLGILLWVSLIWFVAFLTRCRPLVLLDVLTAAWIIFLIENSLSANGLRYAELVKEQPLLQSAVSPWWLAVEFTMLVSLLYALYASYRLFVTGKRYAALALGSGLSVLLLAVLSDHLMNSGVMHSAYLVPFGFAGFLLIISLYSQLAGYLRKRSVIKPAVIPELTFNPKQTPVHSGVVNQEIPLRGDSAEQADSPRPPADPACETAEAPTMHSTHEDTVNETPPPERNPAYGLDQQTLNTISDNLIDIAAFATLTINYVKRGETDPRAMEMLCRKMRTHAINTRQLANQFSLSGDDQK